MKTKDRFGRDFWEYKPLNSKKSIVLPTNTNYFEPTVTRVVNTFSSPRSYRSRTQKIEGYETRLYWQYRYCDEHNGQTFFYTLTYNDRHMPTFYGMNCFDYEDLRDLLTGGFRKQLLRKYGTHFKYFIGAELGDGKGSRGMHNNPHYHILFFLENAKNERYPYKKISPEDFRHLVRQYWQGFDEDKDGFKDYRTARYGIAREGENLGLVTDFRACMYVAKYVTKDVKLVQFEGKLRQYLSQDVFDKYYETDDSYRAFFTDYIEPNYEHYEVDEVAPWDEGFEECTYSIDDTGFKVSYKAVPPTCDSTSDIIEMIDKFDLSAEYRHFVRVWIVPKVEDYMKEYRNRYCNKCRISQGVGDYALEQPGYDKLSGTIPVPSKKGFKSRPINLYYYRKLFTNTYVPKGEKSPRYIINELGVQYKMSRLSSTLDRIQQKADNYLNIVLNNRDVYGKMLFSDVNETFFTPYSEFLDYWNYLLLNENKDKILRTYAEYKFIYENRFFQSNCSGSDSCDGFPPICCESDYYRFITAICYRRNSYRASSFLEDSDATYVSYQSHPYFLRYIELYNLLDLCSDYFFIQSDNKAQKDAEDRAAVKRFHNKQKLVEFYSRFQ